MNFFNLIFLWASGTIIVPILIALWNRRHHHVENFGGFMLLKRAIESSRRRIRLLEIIKLLNRIFLVSLLILFFAEPFSNELKIRGAEDGFALILDVGRVMQGHDASKEGLAQLELQRARDLLSKMPSHSFGVVLFASDRCDTLKTNSHEMTARADEWMDRLKMEAIPYSNSQTLWDGISQCLSQADSIFGKKTIYRAFLSPMPATIDHRQLAKAPLNFEVLPVPIVPKEAEIELSQESQQGKIRLSIASNQAIEAEVIGIDKKVEPLGTVNGPLDLSSATQSWLYLKALSESDPWVNSRITSLHSQSAHEITVWAAKETPGYISLITALRSYSGMKISRQIGDHPTGASVIIYGSYQGSLSNFERVWLFLDSHGTSPFKVRDSKTWSSHATSSDLLKSFHIQTQDGRIFVKRYSLLDLDQFEILEGFEDGAPSLLSDRTMRTRVWVSPFDLEDLTTDLALEPVFIPYLYRKLESWLSLSKREEKAARFAPIWLYTGSTPAPEQSVSERRWPGIYVAGEQSKIVEPVNFPTTFLKPDQSRQSAETDNEKVSLKDKIIKFILFSLFLEILLCLLPLLKISRSGVMSLFIVGLILSRASSLEATPVQRIIDIGYFSGIDADRKLSLEQTLQEIEHLSNLEFSKPTLVNLEDLSRYSLIIGSARSFGPFSKDQRESIRDYCERGGLLFFDDPLATGESSFHRAVQEELDKIFPSRGLKAVSKDDVIFRTFYLLQEVSGRKLASPYLEGVEFDRRWVALFSFNDLLGAVLKSSNGDYALSVSPYGISQRVLAKRLLLNVLMYSVTLDYKDDAIHLPHILKRRVK